MATSGTKRIGIPVAISSCFFIATAALAQYGSPVPGARPSAGAPAAFVNPYVAPPYGAPVPSALPKASAPIPGAANPMAAPVATNGARTAYEALPLNAGNAIARLEELRNLMPSSNPKAFQDTIGEYCDWLADMADAHWKLYQTFAKSDSTKPQAAAEKELNAKFGSLKRQAMLLKAEFLIRQKRYPEALGPLVDIVVAEPKTETGQNAYRLLQEIGFSQEVTPTTATTPKPTANKPVPLAKAAGTAN